MGTQPISSGWLSKWRTFTANNTKTVRHFGEESCRICLPSSLITLTRNESVQFRSITLPSFSSFLVFFRNSAVYSAYNPSYSNNYGSVAPVNTYNPSTYAQPSQRSFSPYASYPSYSNNYPTSSYPSSSYPNNYNNYYPSNNYNNYYPSNTYSPNLNSYYPTNSYGTSSYTVPSPVSPAGNYALSFRSADPLEPEEPGSDSSSKAVQAAPLLPRSIPSPVAASIPSNVGFSGSAQQFAAQSLAASTSVSSDAVAAPGLGGSSGAGIGTGYAAATPDGASYVGPGSPGFAQSSPNTATGSLYNPKYGSSPRFYGAAAPTGVAASPALLYPYFLYYPVQYGK